MTGRSTTSDCFLRHDLRHLQKFHITNSNEQATCPCERGKRAGCNKWAETMLSTWLNTNPDMDYQPRGGGVDPNSPGIVSGLFQMKFSTRIDTDLPAERLFEAVGNFDAIERLLIARGASVVRIDPAAEPDTVMGWHIGFDWRGLPRKLRLAVTRFDRPERVMMVGRSDALDLSINTTIVALSRVRSRLLFETEVRPRNMKARLMLQTAKLGKSQLDRRYQRRVEEFVTQMRGYGD